MTTGAPRRSSVTRISCSQRPTTAPPTAQRRASRGRSAPKSAAAAAGSRSRIEVTMLPAFGQGPTGQVGRRHGAELRAGLLRAATCRALSMAESSQSSGTISAASCGSRIARLMIWGRAGAICESASSSRVSRLVVVCRRAGGPDSRRAGRIDGLRRAGARERDDDQRRNECRQAETGDAIDHFTPFLR